MQQIKTIIQRSIYKDLQKADDEINAVLSSGEGWRVKNMATGFNSTDLDDRRIVTFIRYTEDDATKAPDDNDPRNLKIFAEEAQQDYSKLHAVVAELGLGGEYCDFIVDTVVKALRKAYAKPTTAQAD